MRILSIVVRIFARENRVFRFAAVTIFPAGSVEA
jgi:hypothetical protein